MKAYRFLPIALLLLMAAWITGCSGEAIPTATSDDATAAPAQSARREEATAVLTEETQEEQGTMTPEPSPQATAVEPSTQAEEVAQLAREDLARRLGLEPDAISVVSVEAVEWPDASLGCPKPGMVYAQVITPGLRVVLEIENEVYEYHFGGGQGVLCDEDQPAWLPVHDQQPDTEPYPPPPISTREIVRPPLR